MPETFLSAGAVDAELRTDVGDGATDVAGFEADGVGTGGFADAVTFGVVVTFADAFVDEVAIAFGVVVTFASAVVDERCEA